MSSPAVATAAATQKVEQVSPPTSIPASWSAPSTQKDEQLTAEERAQDARADHLLRSITSGPDNASEESSEEAGAEKEEKELEEELFSSASASAKAKAKGKAKGKAKAKASAKAPSAKAKAKGKASAKASTKPSSYASAKAPAKASAPPNPPSGATSSTAKVGRPAAAAENVKAAADLKKAQSAFVVDVKRAASSGNEDKKATLELYQSLGAQDPLKRFLIESWSKDRSCKWVTSVKEAQETALTFTDHSSHGYQTYLQIAKHEGLDVESPAQKAILERILQELPSDMDWDETKPIQRAYKANNLKRYRVDYDSLSTRSLSRTKTEGWSSTKGKADKVGGTALLDKASSVKVEVNQDLVRFQTADKTLKQADGVVGKLKGSFDSHKVWLEVPSSLSPELEAERVRLNFDVGGQPSSLHQLRVTALKEG